ncbi:MAG: DUF2259 domain-containing protein [SAR324 cluster bacterium]|nr:DUF2259 domain-containing protein [SAR324 cluster bacterium]
MKAEKIAGGSSIGLFLLACFFMLAPAALAAPAQGETEAAIIGFSPNGKYVAYEEYGISAVSPEAYSIIRIVNVRKNSFVGKRIVHVVEFEEQLDMDGIRSEAREKAGILFRRLGISPGERPGREINIMLKKSPNAQGGFRIDFTANKKSYRLELFERVYQRKGLCQAQMGDTKMKIFILRVKDRQSGALKILQKDRKLYKSRGCVFNYDFTSAYTYRDRLVVFIKAELFNDEGTEIKQLVVTGTLKFK